MPEFDFTETLVYYMLPSFVIFVMVAFIFYFFHPFTTDDKCFEFKRRVVSIFIYIYFVFEAILYTYRANVLVQMFFNSVIRNSKTKGTTQVKQQRQHLIDNVHYSLCSFTANFTINLLLTISKNINS